MHGAVPGSPGAWLAVRWSSVVMEVCRSTLCGVSEPSTLQPSSLQSAMGKVRSHGLRYSMVSVINVAVGQALLFILVRLLTWYTDWSQGMSWTVANIVAVSLGALPSYFLNRIWVWGKRGPSHLTREILPFWGFAFAGLVLSTGAVSVAANLTDVKIVANIANIVAFGLLWVVKFFVLDSMVFGDGQHDGTGDEAGDDAGEVPVVGSRSSSQG
jgi:putative flippase GtrA